MYLVYCLDGFEINNYSQGIYGVASFLFLAI